MLTIRGEQMQALESAVLKDFEIRTAKHLERRFPKNYEVLGEEGVRGVIRYGLERAKSHGFKSEQNVVLYIDLMFMLGGNFDEDIQLPWASEILGDTSIWDEVVRIDRLYSTASEYLDRVAGVRGEHLEAALRQVNRESMEPEGRDRESFEDSMLLKLDWLFPQKYAASGEDVSRALIGQGIETARQYSINGFSGAALYIMSMFFLGALFDKDPQFPWASEILNDDGMNETEKVDKLYSTAMSLLKKWFG